MLLNAFASFDGVEDYTGNCSDITRYCFPGGFLGPAVDEIYIWQNISKLIG
jgi:hypothetical protein